MTVQMVPISDFRTFVKPIVQTVSNPMLDNAIRMSAAEFCMRTKSWRHISKFALKHREPVIPIPTNTEIVKIERMMLDDKDLEPIDFTLVDEQSFTADPEGGTATWFTQSSPDHVRTIPPAYGAAELVLILKPAIVRREVALGSYAPVNPAIQLPQFLLKHAEVIAHGAISRLCMIPNQEFTNDGLASAHFGLFDSKVTTLEHSNRKGQQHAKPKRNFTFY